MEVLRHSAAEPHTLDRDVEVVRRCDVQTRAPGQRRSRTRGFTAPRSQIAPGARSERGAVWRVGAPGRAGPTASEGAHTHSMPAVLGGRRPAQRPSGTPQPAQSNEAVRPQQRTTPAKSALIHDPVPGEGAAVGMTHLL